MRFPLSGFVEDLMKISDAGEIMPPKSTWFEPKLRDGLVSSFDLKLLKKLDYDKCLIYLNNMDNDNAKRIYNFSAGPAVLPEDVLKEAQENLICSSRCGNVNSGNKPSFKNIR